MRIYIGGINSLMFRSVISNYAFVLLDVTLKLYMLMYTVGTNYLLGEEEFNRVSFFRATLMMFVGVLSTALGYFILNFYRTSKEEWLAFKRLNWFVLTVVLIGSVLFWSLDATIGGWLSKSVQGGEYFLFGVCIVAAFVQILVYFIRVQDCFSPYWWEFVLLNVLLIMFSGGAFWVFDSVMTPYYVLSAFYGLNLVLFLRILAGSSDFQLIGGALKSFTNPLDHRVARFYFPNLIESLFSTPRTWLSFIIFISIIGMEKIGEILLLQMFLGLYVFFSNSFVLNAYIRIDVVSLNSRNSSLKMMLRKTTGISFLVLLMAFLLWDQLRILLNIRSISDFHIYILILGAVLQVQLLPLGAIFKKMDLSKFTMYHNLIYMVLFLGLEYYLLLDIGVDGYFWAYFIAWLVVALIMGWQALLYQVCELWTFLLYSSSLLLLATTAFIFTV